MAGNAGKEAAANAAATLIENGMTVGLGTGTTAAFFVRALAHRVQHENLALRGVATSRAAEALARSLGIATYPLGRDTQPDVTVDGADEFDPALNLIKGGGGALVEEKLVAVSSRRMIVIADESKRVDALGAFPLPVAVVPFGWQTTHDRLAALLGQTATLRPQKDDAQLPFVTDDGLYILDFHFGATITDPARLHETIRGVVGVAEVGLFVGIAHTVLMGHADGNVTTLTRPT